MPRRVTAALPVVAVVLVVPALLMLVIPLAPARLSGSPSGQALPVGDLPGWRQVFADDFDRQGLGSDWGTYSANPKGDPFSTWTPRQVSIADGLLVLTAAQVDGRWLTGGVSNWPHAQTFGKWQVRFRVDPSPDISYALLLWPQDEVWPPEIDFAEDAGGSRSVTTATVHHDRPGQKVQHELAGDFTAWHTLGVEWTSDAVTYTVDGVPWARVVGDRVPQVPMWLGMQIQSGACRRTPGSCSAPVPDGPVRLEVDWVSVYAPA